MLLRRCGWHRLYFRHPLVNGIASWRGWGIKFTDGICHRCVIRVLTELREIERRPTPGRAPESRAA